MSTFGDAALDQVIGGGNRAVTDAAQEVQLFEMPGAYPLTQIASCVGITLVIVSSSPRRLRAPR